MAEQLAWFRCHVDILDDEKLGLLAFEDRWHFIALLACKAKGLMDPEDEFARRKIQRKLGLTMDEFDKAIERLARMKLVDKETLEPINWDKRQFTSDKSTARVQAYRERMKRSRNVSETPPEYREQNTETEEKTNTGDLTVTSGSRKRAPAVPVSDVVDLYHEMLCPPLPKVEKLTDTRRGLIQQRWREDLPDLHSWADFFRRVQSSDFLMGRSQPRDGRPVFRADLEWICRPANFAKITEGKYDLSAGRRSLADELTDRSWAGEPKRKKPDWLIGAI